jgi:hypothetical protein
VLLFAGKAHQVDRVVMLAGEWMSEPPHVDPAVRSYEGVPVPALQLIVALVPLSVVPGTVSFLQGFEMPGGRLSFGQQEKGSTSQNMRGIMFWDCCPVDIQLGAVVKRASHAQDEYIAN